MARQVVLPAERRPAALGGVSIATPPADKPSSSPRARPIFSFIIAVLPSIAAASAATRSDTLPITPRIVAWINGCKAASASAVRAAASNGAVSDKP